MLACARPSACPTIPPLTDAEMVDFVGVVLQVPPSFLLGVALLESSSVFVSVWSFHCNLNTELCQCLYEPCLVVSGIVTCMKFPQNLVTQHVNFSPFVYFLPCKLVTSCLNFLKRFISGPRLPWILDHSRVFVDENSGIKLFEALRRWDLSVLYLTMM